VLAGAAKIVAVDVVPKKLEWAKEFGATDVVDASKVDPVAAIRDLTGGGADYTFECVGNLAVIQQALEALGPGGALTIVGVPKMGSSYSFVVHALYQNKAILGCRYGTARPRRDFPMLADLYLAGRLKIAELITRHYPLDETRQAFDDLQRGALARGVFTVAEKG
ncbi:MAG: zinc-binding dehydrogenase, partial [Candidatus Binatia bacterium]